MMKLWQVALCGLVTLSSLSGLATASKAQVMVIGGGPVYGLTVVVGQPVVPAPIYSAPLVVSAGYATPYPSYSVSYGGYSGYSAYRPVAPATYIAPAPVVAYRPVVPTYAPAYVPAYVPARTPVVTSRTYYPGQPVRNALRVIAP